MSNDAQPVYGMGISIPFSSHQFFCTPRMESGDPTGCYFQPSGEPQPQMTTGTRTTMTSPTSCPTLSRSMFYQTPPFLKLYHSSCFIQLVRMRGGSRPLRHPERTSNGFRETCWLTEYSNQAAGMRNLCLDISSFKETFLLSQVKHGAQKLP